MDGSGYPVVLPEGATAFTAIGAGAGEGWCEPGRYVCLHDGAGELQFEGDATSFVKAGTGRYEVDVTPGGVDGLVVRIASTDEADHLRNIRIVLVRVVFWRATLPFFHVTRIEPCPRS